MSRHREQLLFRYSSALERGDFETVAAVLRDAEHDPLLEQMIRDLNEAYTAEPSVNHKNPKEVPMIAALYQQRTPNRVQWQSLPLVAALAVIGLLVAVLAVQTRGNPLSNSGQSGSPAQVNSLCQGTSGAAANLYSRPARNSVVVGAVAANLTVSVLDQELIADQTGTTWELWYFVTAQGAQGWTPASSINGSGCPQASVIQPGMTASTPTIIQAAGALATIPPLVAVTVAQPTVVSADVVPVTALVQATGVLATVPPPVAFAVAQPTIVSTDVAPVPAPVQATGVLATVPPPVAFAVAQPTVVAPNPETLSASLTFPVIVQPGDTPLSIIERFNGDASLLPEVLHLNNLAGNTALTAGAIFLMPVLQKTPTLSCTLHNQQQIGVYFEPSDSASPILTLQAGSNLVVFVQLVQAGGAWYPAIAQKDGTFLSGVWVRAADVNLISSDCQPPTAAIITAASALVSTAEPVPNVTPVTN